MQSLDRCASVDETLSRLARNYPSTKFLRARAGAIGFASSSGSRPGLGSGTSFGLSRVPARQPLANIRHGVQERDEFFDDDNDEGSDNDDDEDQDEEQWEDDEVDTDVLPTLLVYRGGELVHSWVRVDWEAKQGLEEFLKRYGACCYVLNQRLIDVTCLQTRRPNVSVALWRSFSKRRTCLR